MLIVSDKHLYSIEKAIQKAQETGSIPVSAIYSIISAKLFIDDLCLFNRSSHAIMYGINLNHCVRRRAEYMILDEAGLLKALETLLEYIDEKELVENGGFEQDELYFVGVCKNIINGLKLVVLQKVPEYREADALIY